MLWQKARTDGWAENFCQKNLVSSSAFEEITLIRTQLLGQLRASGFVKARGSGDIRDLNTNSDNWAVVKASIVAGMYPNIAFFNSHKGTFQLVQNSAETRLHPCSVLCSDPDTSPRDNSGDWLVYDQCITSSLGPDNIQMLKCCTLVSPLSILLMAGPARTSRLDTFRSSATNLGDLKLQPVEVSTQDYAAVCTSPVAVSFFNNVRDVANQCSANPLNPGRLDVETRFPHQISFMGDVLDCQLVGHLRQKWNSLFLRRLRNPSKPSTASDEATLKTVVSLLTQEDHQLGMRQPFGIGVRPKPLLAESYNSEQGMPRRTGEVERRSAKTATPEICRLQLVASLLQRKQDQQGMGRKINDPTTGADMVKRVMSMTLTAANQEPRPPPTMSNKMCWENLNSAFHPPPPTRPESVDAREAASYESLDRQTSLVLKSCLQ
ncbi:3'-5' RNA helicase ythdc2 [Cichlidogyrus casuarinus]|uniref:3'-5' RNA helicase ythdc2 n=1 Tax=Cichlidogyrus casuarinus TaxID=1844966 RepID=A0ABD2QHM4_9PLAT